VEERDVRCDETGRAGDKNEGSRLDSRHDGLGEYGYYSKQVWTI
jgi:hypothetical protein